MYVAPINQRSRRYFRCLDFRRAGFCRLGILLGVVAFAMGCSIEDRLPPGVHIAKPGENPTNPGDLPGKRPGEGNHNPPKDPPEDNNPSDLNPDFPDDSPDDPANWPSGPLKPPQTTISSISPTIGSIDGGDEVFIHGSQFSGETRVFFGPEEAACEYDNRTSGTELVCTAPAMKHPGTVSLRLINPKTLLTPLEAPTLPDAFTYYMPASITEVRPAKLGVSMRNNQTPFIHLIGNGFTQKTHVSIAGKEAIEVRYIDSKHLLVLPAPFDTKSNPDYGVISPNHPTVAVPITVTTQYESIVLPQGLEYYTPLVIDSIEHAEGSTAGGDSITIKGAGFDQSSRVYFGRTLSNVTSVAANGESLTVTTPPGKQGYTNVSITNTLDSSIKQNGYYFTSTPATLDIASVTPNSGDKNGGGKVLITGAGIRANAKVTFGDGGTPIQATVMDGGNGWIKVTVPAWHTSVVGRHDVDITITTPAHGSDPAQVFTKHAAYTYTDRVTLTQAAPSVTSANGGAKITLSGEGLSQITQLRIDGLVIPFTVIDDQTIECLAPRHRPGPATIQANIGDASYQFSDLIDFTEDFSLLTVTPTVASISGGTLVEIIGTGFNKQTTVTFDGIPATSIKEQTSHRMIVAVPPHAMGDVEVVVTDRSQSPEKSITYGSAFRYINPIHQGGGIFGGPIEGAINVAVISEDGIPVPKAIVTLSTASSPTIYATTNAKGLATLSGPDILGEQTVSVSAYGYTSTSIQRVNSSNITVVLALRKGFTADSNGIAISLDNDPDKPNIPSDTDPVIIDPEEPLPNPVLQGELFGLDKLGIPQPNEILRAYIFTTQTTPKIPNRVPESEAILSRSGHYRIQTREGDQAIIAIGGLYNTSSGSFRPLAMGLQRNLTMSRGDSRNINITLNIPMNVTMRAKLEGSPKIFAGKKKLVKPWIHLGYEGYFSLRSDVPEGSGDIIEIPYQPNLERDLPGASYYLEGGVSKRPGLWGFPITLSIKRDVTDQSSLITFPGLYGVPILQETANELSTGITANHTFHFTLDPPQKKPDLIYINLDDYEGNTMWTITLPGDARSFKLPSLPNTTIPDVTERNGKALEPSPPGLYKLYIFAIDNRYGNYRKLSLRRILQQNRMNGMAFQIYNVNLKK